MRPVHSTRRRSLAALLGLIGGGSLAVAAPDSPARASSHAVFVHHRPITGNGDWHAEPAVAVDPTDPGRVYVANRDDTANANAVHWTTTFGGGFGPPAGGSFTHPSGGVSPATDVDVVVDSEGRVFTHALNGAVSVYEAGAVTSTGVTTQVGTAQSGADRPWLLASTTPGEVYLFWQLNPTSVEHFGKVQRVGSGWALTTVERAIVDSLGQAGPLAYGPGGDLIAAYPRIDGGVGLVRRTTVAGATVWRPTIVAATPVVAGFPVAATDASGRIYVTWGDELDVYVAVSTTGGLTFGPPVRVNVPGHVATTPTMVVGPQGTVAVAYYTTAAPETGAVRPPASIGSPATEWIVELAVSADPAAANPGWQRSQVSDGIVQRGSISSVIVRPCDPNAPGGPFSKRLADDFEMARAESGMVVVAYAAGTRLPAPATGLQPCGADIEVAVQTGGPPVL